MLVVASPTPPVSTVIAMTSFPPSSSATVDRLDARRRLGDTGSRSSARRSRPSGPVTVSWRQIHDEARAVAAALQAQGLIPGDHVAVLGPTSRALITAVRGVLACRADVDGPSRCRCAWARSTSSSPRPGRASATATPSCCSSTTSSPASTSRLREIRRRRRCPACCPVLRTCRPATPWRCRRRIPNGSSSSSTRVVRRASRRA